MPAINFAEQFCFPVEFGEKRQTIRKQRKRNPIKVGDRLYLYTGMRTKHARRLRVERCEAVIPLWIERDGSIFLDKKKLDGKESDKMARADGFQTVDDFVSWFRGHYGLPFYGVLIRW